MDKKYYVQVIAGNYLKNVSPESPNVHDKFLQGLTVEEFTDGFNSLSSLVRQLYNDIAHNPADFNMMLKEIEDIKNTDYTNSNASFLRVPNLLYALGVSSILESDGVLTVDGGILADNAKTLKITGLPLLLAKLRDYGFEVSDFGKAPKAGTTLSVTYIDNRHLTTALKAMADALSELTAGDLRNPKNDHFYLMNPALLENETVKEPKLTISSIYHALDPIQSGYAATLHSFVEDNTKHSVQSHQLMRNDWSCTYTRKKNKKVLMKLKIDQNNLSVKLNLQNISQYISLVADMPEKIRNAVYYGGWECGNCNPRCSGGFTFETDGKSYNKCHCGSFVFTDLTEEDMIFYQKLLEKEI
jgi:hypothetical protein